MKTDIMTILGSILFVIGLIAYGYALVHFNSGRGEIGSDIGNGIMLSTCVLLLLFRSKKEN